MQEGQLLMTQADRDRLVALKKVKKKLITQREAAQEVGVSVRHVRRLLDAEQARRQGRGACTTRGAVEPQDRREDRESGGSGRLFLERVARQQSPSPLYRHSQNITRSATAWVREDISTLH